MNKIVAACLLGSACLLPPVASAAETWLEVRPEDGVELLNDSRYRKDSEDRLAFIATVTKALSDDDVTALERIASSVWKTKATLSSGRPKLVTFYAAIGVYSADFKGGDSRWDRLFVTMSNWEQASPRSPFAKLAWTKVLRNQAWAIRGDKYSSETPHAAMSTFESKIEEAGQLLQNSRALTSTVPEWYQQMLEVYMDMGAPLDKVTALVDEGIRRFPTYDPIVETASASFLPKWNGSDEEFARFARHVNETAPDGNGPRLYARLYYAVSYSDYYYNTVFSKGGADWPTLKKGLEANLRLYPSASNEDRLAYFACAAADVELLPKLMDRIGNSPHPEVWKETKMFRSCQIMAQLMKQHPLGPPSTWYPRP